ncbi:MAG: formate dehydrogenase [Mycobacteriaceae bacterium]|nr:formate dehydrogenase [Mycobacteriaceae bacterium]
MQIEVLVRMAQQIARNNAALGPDRAAAKIAGHLQSFWTPAMIDELLAFAALNPGELDPNVRTALSRLDRSGSG